MEKSKVIEILSDLQSYVEDNWDRNEYEADIRENAAALEFAIRYIRESNVVGSMYIGDDRYIISQ